MPFPTAAPVRVFFLMVEFSKVTCYCLNFPICFVRISSMMSLDVLVACAVLQDHADQLSVLGNIITGAETVSNVNIFSY